MKISWVQLPRHHTFFLALGSLCIIGGCILLCQLFGVMLCPLRRYTGIPCFTCGSTRAILALVSGDVTTAFLTQPLVISLVCMLAPILLFNSCAAILQKRILLFSLSRTEKTVLFFVLAVATLINWFYLLSKQ